MIVWLILKNELEYADGLVYTLNRLIKEIYFLLVSSKFVESLAILKILLHFQLLENDYSGYELLISLRIFIDLCVAYGLISENEHGA